MAGRAGALLISLQTKLYDVDASAPPYAMDCDGDKYIFRFFSIFHLFTQKFRGIMPFMQKEITVQNIRYKVQYSVFTNSPVRYNDPPNDTKGAYNVA